MAEPKKNYCVCSFLLINRKTSKWRVCMVLFLADGYNFFASIDGLSIDYFGIKLHTSARAGVKTGSAVHLVGVDNQNFLTNVKGRSKKQSGVNPIKLFWHKLHQN